jgi:hypothetical protein
MPSLADLPDLTGFFSYSRRDDEHSQGSLSRLRAQIYNELRLQLGFNFKLWQDTEAIAEGTEWEGEIQRAISESVFFIPIVTPSSVASIHCRKEFEAFLDREEALGRKNLVFPLLYVRVPALEKEELWRQDPLLGIIGRRQYFDWQRFRHRSFSESASAEKIEQFCRSIVESLQQEWMSPEQRRAAEEAQARRIAEQARRDGEEKIRQQADAEARRRIERERRAAAEAEAHLVAEQARWAQEEKRQRADAEAWPQAQQQRRAEEGEGWRLTDQARRDQEKKKYPQEDTDAWEAAEGERWVEERRYIAPAEKQRQRAIIIILVITLVALVPFVLWSTYSSPDKTATVPPATPPTVGVPSVAVPGKPGNVPPVAVPSKPANVPLKPRDVQGCKSIRTVNKSGGNDIAILADDNSEAANAAQSARSAAEQDGFNVASYARQRLQEDEVSVAAYVAQLRKANVAIVCGSVSPSFWLKLKIGIFN